MSPESRSSAQGSTEERAEQSETFKRIGTIFILNVQAIRVFNEQIGPVADEHDRSVMQQLNDRLREIVPTTEESGGTLEIVESNGESGAGPAVEGRGEAPEESRHGSRRISVGPETMRSLLQAIRSTAKRSPGQGAILRRGALTTLLSFFEVLVSDLIQLYYSMYPSALPADQKLSLADLRELGSIEDAEKALASREAEKVLHGKSLEDQLGYFSNKLNVGLKPLDPELESLVEIDQRRNLLVHNDGVVNRRYLSRVADRLIEEYKIEQGETLVVTENYLAAAIDTLYVVGLTLVQLCWRNWDKDSTEEADGFAVTDMLYESLREERFDLVKRMAERLRGARYAKEQSKRMAIINYAIALKELGCLDEMESVLSMDWSGFSLEFKLALHALRNEEEEFYQLLPRAVAAEMIEKWQLEEWPVFAHQRGTERFAEALERHFPNGASDSPDGSGDN